MKREIQSFKKFLKEKDGEKDRSDIYQIQAMLVVSSKQKRNKGDILSDVRAVEGITTVSVVDQKDMAGKDYSQVTIKIDTTPIRALSLSGVLLKIKRSVNNIPGVARFEYLSRAKAI